MYFSKSVCNPLTHFVEGMRCKRFTGTLTDIYQQSLHNRNCRNLRHFLSRGKGDEQCLQHIIGNVACKQVKWNAEQSLGYLNIINRRNSMGWSISINKLNLVCLLRRAKNSFVLHRDLTVFRLHRKDLTL